MVVESSLGSTTIGDNHVTQTMQIYNIWTLFTLSSMVSVNGHAQMHFNSFAAILQPNMNKWPQDQAQMEA